MPSLWKKSNVSVNPTRNINERLACLWYGVQKTCNQSDPTAAGDFYLTIWKKILSVQAEYYKCNMGESIFLIIEDM